MATTSRVPAIPAGGSSSVRSTSLRQRGIGLSLVALGGAMVAFAGSLSAAQITADGGSATDVAALGLWTFGLTTAAFGTAKFGIAATLLAIVRRITARADSIKFALPKLKAATGQASAIGEYDSPLGAVVVTDGSPAPLLIHRFAGIMWLPTLAMAAMALYGGFALSLVASGNAATDPQLANSQRAWVQGLQFLGEGLVLSGISFLLARILGTLRASGGEVQTSVGLRVHTLRMPTSAKAFVVLMMVGLMVEIAQLVGYAYVAGLSDAGEIAVAPTFLGPLREFGLGLLLSGIVLALATIARALDFQSTRLVSIITRGQ